MHSFAARYWPCAPCTHVIHVNCCFLLLVQGTIRSLTHSGLERLHSRVEEVALLTARTYGCNATVTWGRVWYLPVVNSPDMVDLVSEMGLQVTHFSVPRCHHIHCCSHDGVSRTTQAPIGLS